jgi:Cdc6-like AAA superfamily ATPase
MNSKINNPIFLPWKDEINKIIELIKSDLLGKKEEIKHTSNECIVVSGFRGTGKTFVLKELNSSISKSFDGLVHTVFLKCNEYTTMEGFVDTLISKLQLSESIPNKYKEWHSRADELLEEVLNYEKKIVIIIDDINNIKLSDLKNFQTYLGVTEILNI